MFTNILDHNISNRELQEYFQHLKSTMSLCFQKVLVAILILHVKYLYLSQLLDFSSKIILQKKNIVSTLIRVWMY